MRHVLVFTLVMLALICLGPIYLTVMGVAALGNWLKSWWEETREYPEIYRR